MFDWQKAIHDPRFWALRYENFPGVTQEEVDAYCNEYDFLNVAILQDDPLAGYAGEGDEPLPADVEIGCRSLPIPFPEGYTWKIAFAAEEGKDMTGIYHELYHPTIKNPQGLSIAVESGSPFLPGLRWIELKQIASCLEQNWSGDFDRQAIVPLLYPVVELITLDELQEVRQTLSAAWHDLQVLDEAQIEPWLNEIITVYDKGWEWRFDGEWKPTYQIRHYEQGQWVPYDGDLWIQTGDKWEFCGKPFRRYTEGDAHLFLPFFTMLERYS